MLLIFIIADLCSEAVDIPWWLYLLGFLFGCYSFLAGNTSVKVEIADGY